MAPNPLDTQVRAFEEGSMLTEEKNSSRRPISCNVAKHMGSLWKILLATVTSEQYISPQNFPMGIMRILGAGCGGDPRAFKRALNRLF